MNITVRPDKTTFACLGNRDKERREDNGGTHFGKESGADY